MADAITTESWVWSAAGTQPAQGDEIYAGGEQPIADYDNWAMWAVTSDIDNLNATLGAHATRHEAGGDDEIDLEGMSVGSAGKFAVGTSPDGSGGQEADVWELQDPADAVVAGIDTTDQVWTEFPALNDTLQLQAGAAVLGGSVDMQASNIVSNAGTIYDAANGWVPQSIIEGGDSFASVDQPETITQPWDFGNTINVYAAQGHIDLFETDNADKQWRFEVQNGNFQVTETGVGTWLRIDPSDGGRVEHPAGASFGDVTQFNDNAEMNGNRVRGISVAEFDDTYGDVNFNPGGADISVNTAGAGGGGFISMWDNENNQQIATFDEGGLVNVPNGGVETQRGRATTSGSPGGTSRHLWVGTQFPAEAENGDLLFEPV